MFKEKMKALMEKEEQKDSKKKIENVVVLIVIVIITIIAINVIWNGDKKQDIKQEETTSITKQLAQEDSKTEIIEEQDIQTKLENILSNITGVGKVKVLISYSESSQVVAMYNENSKNSQVEEKDSTRRNKTNYSRGYTKRYYLSRGKWKKRANHTKNCKS